MKDTELDAATNDFCKRLDTVIDLLHMRKQPPIESEYCWICSMRLDHNGRCPYHTIDDE
jgi:hypothetical protein